MRIYLDVCCLNRPFDDLTQERVQFESDAILAMLSRCQAGTWTLVSSEAIDLEIGKIRNSDKRTKVISLLSVAAEKLMLSEAAIIRSLEFQNNGVKPMDSLHLAIAEDSKVDIFLTTDDPLLSAARKMNVGIRAANPVIWFMEVMQNER